MSDATTEGISRRRRLFFVVVVASVCALLISGASMAGAEPVVTTTQGEASSADDGSSARTNTEAPPSEEPVASTTSLPTTEQSVEEVAPDGAGKSPVGAARAAAPPPGCYHTTVGFYQQCFYKYAFTPHIFAGSCTQPEPCTIYHYIDAATWAENGNPTPAVVPWISGSTLCKYGNDPNLRLFGPYSQQYGYTINRIISYSEWQQTNFHGWSYCN